MTTDQLPTISAQRRYAKNALQKCQDFHNRKNSLFVGNPRGGRTAAILASLTSTCRRHDIDPQLYLTQLLTNLSQVRKSELPNWLPDQWKRLQEARRLS